MHIPRAALIAMAVIGGLLSAAYARSGPTTSAAISWWAVAALFLGVLLGSAYARAHRAHHDWRNARRAVRRARRSMLAAAGSLTRVVVVAGVLFAIAVAAINGR